jgi:hypothetical protein
VKSTHFAFAVPKTVPEGVCESAWKISRNGENSERYSGHSTEMQKLKSNARGIGLIATPKPTSDNPSIS